VDSIWVKAEAPGIIQERIVADLSRVSIPFW
jgi:hypothetical protein